MKLEPIAGETKDSAEPARSTDRVHEGLHGELLDDGRAGVVFRFAGGNSTTGLVAASAVCAR